MKGHGEKFSRKMEEAIIALLTQPTIPEAAKAAGVSDTTLWRWLQDPEFQAAYREARQRAVGQAIAQLQQLGSAAVRALRSVIEDEKAPHSARVAAARAAFELAYRGVEVEDWLSVWRPSKQDSNRRGTAMSNLERRLKKLEDAAAAQSERGGIEFSDGLRATAAGGLRGRTPPGDNIAAP